MTRTPGIGVIGCGYWGKNLVRNFAELHSLKAVCDVDVAAAQSLGEKFGVPATKSVEELLAMPEIDAVAIAAPAAQHYEIAKKAVLAGKDAFVEKPLALQVKEGEDLVELARKHNRILMVGHLLQYHPAILELRRLIQQGELGRINYIYSSRLNFGKLRTEENIMWSFAPHDLSAILYLLGESPISVSAEGSSYLNQEISDVTMTHLAFASGVKAHIFVSWLHPFKEQKLVIVGDAKMAVFDDTLAEGKLTVYPHQVAWLNRVPVARKANGNVVPISTDEPLRLECQHFLDSVRDHTQPRTDGENGLNVLRLLHACEDSVRNRGAQTVLNSRPAAPKPYFVHSSAIVDEPSEVGAGTKIWHFSHIMPGSKIGKNCNFGQNVHVASGVKIGDNVKIQNNVSVYTGVELGDDVFCGPSMVFTNVITPRSHVNRRNEYMPTKVGRGATFGANCTVVCGVNVGQYAFIAAGAVVTRDVPEYALMMGVPARQMGSVCRCGVRLQTNGDGGGTCSACGEQYCVEAGQLRPVPARAA